MTSRQLRKRSPATEGKLSRQATERGRSQRQRLQLFAADTATSTVIARGLPVERYRSYADIRSSARSELKLVRRPRSLAATLAALPSISEIPFLD